LVLKRKVLGKEDKSSRIKKQTREKKQGEPSYNIISGDMIPGYTGYIAKSEKVKHHLNCYFDAKYGLKQLFLNQIRLKIVIYKPIIFETHLSQNGPIWVKMVILKPKMACFEHIVQLRLAEMIFFESQNYQKRLIWLILVIFDYLTPF